MKTSGSPCPLDQSSIICYKRYPYLRSYLTVIIAEIWEKSHTTDLEKVITIFIHKKGSTNKTGNFHPISLETVNLNICVT